MSRHLVQPLGTWCAQSAEGPLGEAGLQAGPRARCLCWPFLGPCTAVIPCRSICIKASGRRSREPSGDTRKGFCAELSEDTPLSRAAGSASTRLGRHSRSWRHGQGGAQCVGIRPGSGGTYVQLHQGHQVLLGGMEDGVRLGAGNGLVQVAVRVVEDGGGRLCHQQALLGLERHGQRSEGGGREGGSLVGSEGGGREGDRRCEEGKRGGHHYLADRAPGMLLGPQGHPGAVTGHMQVRGGTCRQGDSGLCW